MRKLFVLTVLVFGVLIASILQSSAQTINGCMNKRTGALRIAIASRPCTRFETAISWNQVGPPGPQGPPGPAGIVPGISKIIHGVIYNYEGSPIVYWAPSGNIGIQSISGWGCYIPYNGTDYICMQTITFQDPFLYIEPLSEQPHCLAAQVSMHWWAPTEGDPWQGTWDPRPELDRHLQVVTPMYRYEDMYGVHNDFLEVDVVFNLPAAEVAQHGFVYPSYSLICIK